MVKGRESTFQISRLQNRFSHSLSLSSRESCCHTHTHTHNVTLAVFIARKGDRDWPWPWPLLLVWASAFQLVLLCSIGHSQDSHRIGETLATSPSLQGNDGVTLFHNAQLECFRQTILDTIVDVFLPLAVALWTRMRVVEWIASSVQVDVSCRVLVSRDCVEKERE